MPSGRSIRVRGSSDMATHERTRRRSGNRRIWQVLVQMRRDVGTFLAWAMRAQDGRGPHAELARQVVLAVLVAQLIAGAQHEGPPHAARRAPRHARAQRARERGRRTASALAGGRRHARG